MTLDITFGDTTWEELLSALKPGQALSAATLLTALDCENEETVAQVFSHLWEMDILPDLTDLPKYKADSETAVRLRREETLAKQGNLMQNLEETDPLRMYLEEIAAIPAYGDIRVLAESLRENNGEDSATAIINLSLNRVVQIACSYTGKGVLLMDLIQEGSMGLWESLPLYDGTDIEQFRDKILHRYMVRAVITQAHDAGVGQKLKQAVEDYRAVDEKLLAELGRNPTLEEIAEDMHMSVQEAATVAQMLENARQLYRAKKPEPEALPQEEDQAVEDTAYFQMRQRIGELLSSLDKQDAQLLTLRYGLEGGLPMDPQQVGARLGLTPEEVVQREAASLAKLRQNKE